ncbi:MAG: ATP-binding cassette domain-containing protein [Candidatus Enteromonas sp.]|nr:ATP-binding cassette domain-containing protein [Candidatus Enteromonas sp.]MDY6093506.1 ATP-binding cassette domain-containing protein [Candidatus Enteromonas sp.]
MKEPIFKATHIVKQFGPTIALNDVDIEIYPGEIRGFIGENGSGKSTMSAIMTGIYEASSGTMEFHGKEWHPSSMIDALSKGIGIIVQENGTISEISVAENIFLGELSKFSGAHYFEERKVDNFSPLFPLDLGEFDAYVASSIAALQKEGGSRANFLAKRKEILETLKGRYLLLAKDYSSKKASLFEGIKNEFNQKAKELFDSFQAELSAIEAKYQENAMGYDEVYKERNRKAEIEQAKKAYRASVSRLDDLCYRKRTFVIEDETALKNHYKNAVSDIKDIGSSPTLKKIKNALLTVVFGLFVNGRKLKKHAAVALSKIGVNDIAPGAPTFLYDMQARKLIEIAKCLNKNPEIFIVDETTTALSETGRNLLYKKMKELRDQGKSVLFISHDLEELMEKCDTLTVLRDGNIVASLSKEKGEFDPEAIKKYMIGRELKGDYYRSDYDGSYGEEVVLKMVDGIQGRDLRHVSLELHKGEILGIGGLSECGMHTLGKALFGNIKMEGGFVYCGERLDQLVHSESFAMAHRIGYLSKNRDVEALALKASIFDNIAIASINNIAKANFLVFKKDETKLVNEQIRSLSIKCNSAEQLVATLSGGNKQKVSLAKWIANDSEILILDCPTRGVDIGVKQFIYQLLYAMKKEGKSILMISEELPELIGMSDRILIMKDGQIQKEFTRSPDLTQEEIIQYMI